MPRPNKLQWVIIWLAVLIAAHFWLNLRTDNLWPGNGYGAWGFPAYLNPATSYRERPKLAVTVLAMGGLLVWMASGKRKGQ
jgi:hypothetical protein